MANNKNSGDESSRQGIKTLVATVSLAATVGGWAMLSANREPATLAVLSPTAVIRNNTTTVIELAPLPTLVSAPIISSTTKTQSVATRTPIPQPTLRAVNNPPPQRVVVIGGGGDTSGGGNSGGGGGSQAAAQTRSSR
jgi:hypothetical protein